MSIVLNHYPVLICYVAIENQHTYNDLGISPYVCITGLPVCVCVCQPEFRWFEKDIDF